MLQYNFHCIQKSAVSRKVLTAGSTQRLPDKLVLCGLVPPAHGHFRRQLHRTLRSRLRPEPRWLKCRHRGLQSSNGGLPYQDYSAVATAAACLTAACNGAAPSPVAPAATAAAGFLEEKRYTRLHIPNSLFYSEHDSIFQIYLIIISHKSCINICN